VTVVSVFLKVGERCLPHRCSTLFSSAAVIASTFEPVSFLGFESGPGSEFSSGAAFVKLLSSCLFGTAVGTKRFESLVSLAKFEE